MDFESTRKLFSGLIEKPPLTDQLLGRPPFKFLLDVFAGTIQNTGYLREQFESSDLDVGTLTDKNAKIAFLEKLIGLVDSDGSLKGVKAAKIVAGKEPENTLLLLNKFAQFAQQSREGSGKENKKKDKDKDKDKEKKRSKSKESSKDRGSSKKENAKDSDKNKDKEKPKDKERSSSREKRSSSKDKEKDKKSEKKEKDKVKEKDKEKKVKEKKESKEKKEKSSEKKEKKEKPVKESPSRRTSSASHKDTAATSSSYQSHVAEQAIHKRTDYDRNEDEASGTAKTEDSGVGDMESPRPIPPHLREQPIQRLGTSAGRPQTSMGRPGTAAARPAPPKLKKKQIAQAEEKIPTIHEAATEIIVENEDTETADNDFVIEEQEPEVEPVESEELDPNLERGGLVSKIMETREQIEEVQSKEIAEEPTDDADSSKIKQKIEVIQKSIQKVTQTTFPIARMIDLIQEDVESMHNELEKWRSEARKNEQILKDREASVMGDSQKYATQLSQLEDTIRETRSQLIAVKGKIVANDNQIRIMIANM